MNQFIYFDSATGGLHNRNKVIKQGDRKLSSNSNVECYETIWRYTEDFDKYVKETGSVEDYKGLHTANEIIFDFDSNDLLRAQTDAKRFITELIMTYDIPLDNIGIFFSGKKGFHITLPIGLLGDVKPSEDFHLKYKEFIKSVIGDRYETADLSIYNPMRLIRIQNTKHGESGLYKIPLSFNELNGFSPQEIKTIARNPKPDDYNWIEAQVEVNPNKVLQAVWDTVELTEEKKSPSERMESNSFINALTGSKEGGRHEQITKIAGFLIDRDIQYAESLALLKLWNLKNNPPLSDERLEKDLKGVYKSYWDKRPQAQAPAVITEPSLKDILVYGDKYTEAYDHHIARIGKYGRIKTGYDIIDEPMRGMIAGEVMIVVGKTSIGKSAFIHNILMNNVDLGRRVLFFSLEMPIATVAERNLQLRLRKSGRQIERESLEGLPFIHTDIERVSKSLERFITIPVQGIKYTLIEKYIKETEDFFGEKIDLVGIDYAGLITFEAGSLYEQQSGIAKDLKALSGRTETGIVNLAQVSKNYKETDPVDLDASRDSGVVIEACDYMIGLWRPAHRQYSDDIAIDGILGKNRNGSRVEFSARMNKTSLLYSVEPRVSAEDYHSGKDGRDEDLPF